VRTCAEAIAPVPWYFTDDLLRSAMVSLKIILICAAVAACLLAIGIQALVSKVQRQRRRKAILSAGGGADAAGLDTIFVSIVGLHDAALLGRTLESLFETAHQPLRVYVGMQEFYDPGNPTTAIDEYRRLVASSSTMPLCLDDHVRVLRVPKYEACGAFAAREQIERMLYKQEVYMMTLHAPARLALHWDKHLIMDLQDQEKTPLHGEEDHGGTGATTGEPGTMLATASASAPHASVMLTTQPITRRGSDVFVGPVLLKQEQPGTFVTVESVRIDNEFSATDPLPIFKAVSARRVAPTPAIAWCPALSFCRAAARIHLPKDVLFADDVEQVWMTSALVAAGWRLVHPAGTIAIVGDQLVGAVATAISRSIHHTTVTTQRRRCKASLHKSYSSILQRIGVTAAGILTARARIGLTAYPSTAEIDTKVGSNDEYLTILSRLELQVRQTPVSSPGSAMQTPASQSVVAPVAVAMPQPPSSYPPGPGTTSLGAPAPSGQYFPPAPFAVNPAQRTTPGQYYQHADMYQANPHQALAQQPTPHQMATAIIGRPPPAPSQDIVMVDVDARMMRAMDVIPDMSTLQ
jgi:hypothetical protein